jgi:uncharacterized protein (TIGR03437 family)
MAPFSVLRQYSAIQFPGDGTYYGVGANVLFVANATTGAVLSTTQYNLGNTGFTALWVTLNGDNTATVYMLSPNGVVVATVTRPAPAISSVLNVFSNQAGATTPSTVGTIALGEWIVLYGTNLAEAATFAATTPLPTSLNNTTAWFQCQGSPPVAMQTNYVGPSQVNALTRPTVPAPSCPVESLSTTTTLPNGTTISSTPVQVSVAPSVPGILMNTATGFVYVGHLDGTANTSATQGETVTLYGVGFGQTQPCSSYPSLQCTVATPTITVNGAPADVLFSGLQPSFVGLYQLNMVVPNVGDGSQPLTVVIAGAASSAMISIQSQ